jgi:hypothetical protein
MNWWFQAFESKSYRNTEKYQFLSVFAKICFPILGIFF